MRSIIARYCGEAPATKLADELMSATAHPIRELVIVGRDAPVWLSACVMQYALGPAGVNVTVVELPPLAQAADLCISLPALEALHSRLRIDESRLIGATRGAFTLGRRFVDGAGDVSSFFHAHGSNGTRIDRKEFLPHWLHARSQGFDQPFEEFSLTAMAARQNRMLLPDAAIDGFGFTDYGYHLPAIPYGAWLQAARPAPRCAQPCHARARYTSRPAARYRRAAAG